MSHGALQTAGVRPPSKLGRPAGAGPSPLAVLLVVFAGGLTGLLNPDPLIGMSVAAAVLAIGALLWRPKALPFLLMPLGLQVAQVTTKPLYSLISGQPLRDLTNLHVDLAPAVYVGLAALVALALGMRLSAGAAASSDEVQPILSPRSAFWVAAASVVIGRAALTVSYFAGPLRQILGAVSFIEFAGVFVLAFTCFRQGRGYGYLAMIFAFEVLSGFMSFFGGFKETFFIVALALACGRQKVSGRDVVLAAALVASLALLSVFWTALKPEYRSFLNHGSGAQVVDRSLGERFEFVTNRAANPGTLQLGLAAKSTVFRLSYVDFLAATMQRVPFSIPHTNGSLTAASIVHVFTPRLFFPEKAKLASDSELTSQYTGLAVASGNTSISIGYVGELYIDFGVVGAIMGALLLGILYGAGFRSIVRFPRLPKLYNYALAAALLLQAVQFERALTKTVGAYVTSFLVLAVVQRALAWGLPTAPTVTR